MGRGGEADIAEAHRGKQTDRSLPYSHREQGFPPCSGTTGTFSWRIKEGAGTVPEKATELRFVSATQLLVAASWIAGQSLKLLSVSCQVVGAQTFSILHLQVLCPLPTILCGLDKVSPSSGGFF